MRVSVSGVTVETKQGDISRFSAEAIVNAANSGLWMGSGVAGAIKSKGGREIEDEAVRKRPLEVGGAIVTTAGKLKAKWVIHAAAMGPDLVTDAEKIRDATRSALEKATELGAESMALPSLGTGVGGFPLDQAAQIMIGEVIGHARKNRTPNHITLVLYTNEANEEFDKALTEALKRI